MLLYLMVSDCSIRENQSNGKYLRFYIYSPITKSNALLEYKILIKCEMKLLSWSFKVLIPYNMQVPYASMITYTLLFDEI